MCLKKLFSVMIIMALLCSVCASCGTSPNVPEPPDPNAVTSLDLDSTTIELLKYGSLKDMCDLWGTGMIELDTTVQYHNKQALDILTKEGWGDYSSEPGHDADIIIRTRQQDGIEIVYIIDIDAGIAVVYPSSDEYEKLPRYSRKELTADELRAVKDLAYYYFSEHLED